MRLPPTLAILHKFNREPLTGGDFMQLCGENNIEVVLSRDVKRGFYYFSDDQHTIALSAVMPPAQRRFIGWHEFAHFLQNFYARKPVAAFSGLVPDEASEKLADVFAMIACRPDYIKIAGPIDFIRMLMAPKKLGSRK